MVKQMVYAGMTTGAIELVTVSLPYENENTKMKREDKCHIKRGSSSVASTWSLQHQLPLILFCSVHHSKNTLEIKMSDVKFEQ